MGDDIEREKSFMQTIGEHWLWMSDGIPWRYLQSHLHHLRLSRLAPILCNPMLSHCYLLLSTKKKCFTHRFFIKHQPHDHLHHHIPFLYHHFAPIAPLSTRGWEWRGTLNRPEMEPSTLNDSYFVLLLLDLLFSLRPITLQTHSISIFVLFRFSFCCLTLAINLDFIPFVWRVVIARRICFRRFRGNISWWMLRALARMCSHLDVLNVWWKGGHGSPKCHSANDILIVPHCDCVQHRTTQLHVVLGFDTF